jgi:hypothetical protein
VDNTAAQNTAANMNTNDNHDVANNDNAASNNHHVVHNDDDTVWAILWVLTKYPQVEIIGFYLFLYAQSFTVLRYKSVYWI